MTRPQHRDLRALRERCRWPNATHPYASWERGANENMNGLIRQIFPKKMRFNSITPKDIAFVMHRLNHRPRKCLGFKTHHEVIMKELNSRQNTVAPRTHWF